MLVLRHGHQVRGRSAATAVKEKGGKYLKLVQKYGVLVVVFHTTVWALVLVSLFAAQHHEDFDIRYALELMLPASMEERKERLLDAAHSSYGKFAIAYVITLATGPPRLGFTLLVTPWMAGTISRLNHPVLNRLLLHNDLLERAFTNPLSLLRRAPRKQAKSPPGAGGAGKGGRGSNE